MYTVSVWFDVEPQHHPRFIAAALENARDSLANEPGTLRFELIADDRHPNRFWLAEAYADLAAFEAHAEGPHVQRFLALVGGYAAGPCGMVTGTRVDAFARA